MQNTAALTVGPEVDPEGGRRPASPLAPLRIVLADDHALVRGGLALLIKMMDDGVEILEASNFEQATGFLGEGPPIDLMLLDLLMPGMDGVDGIRRIHETWPDVPVVVVSVREDSGAIREALKAGAMGYIPKTSSPKVTTNALRFILDGGVYVPPHVLHLADSKPAAGPLAENDPGLPTGTEDEEATALGLTGRQLEVIELLAQGCSNKDIAARLDISAGTVKMHVSRIFKILKVENRTQAAARLAELKTAAQSGGTAAS